MSSLYNNNNSNKDEPEEDLLAMTIVVKEIMLDFCESTVNTWLKPLHFKV